MVPMDHDARLARARLSLEGLSVGDAFGETFFVPPARARELIEQRRRYRSKVDMTGAWSDAFWPLRASRSMRLAVQRSARPAVA
jgi:hypothetical protein